jgi:hypothetical protein
VLAEHLIRACRMFFFLAVHRAVVFRDANYAGLFAPAGAGSASIPAIR